MNHTDEQRIEQYLRGEMLPEERAVFEQRLEQEPLLRQRYEELELLAEGIRSVALRDLRQTVEQVSEKIRGEENEVENPRFRPARLMWFAFGLIAGICIGWLVWGSQEGTGAEPHPTQQSPRGGVSPVAAPQFETLATLSIPSTAEGKNIPLTVLHDPAATDSRRYALDPGGVGLCLYTTSKDPVWRAEIVLNKEGARFFLQIGSQRFEVLDDSNEHPLKAEK